MGDASATDQSNGSRQRLFRAISIALVAAIVLMAINWGILLMWDHSQSASSSLDTDPALRASPSPAAPIIFLLLGLVELLPLYWVGAGGDPAARKYRVATLVIMFPFYWIWPIFLLVFFSAPIDST